MRLSVSHNGRARNLLSLAPVMVLVVAGGCIFPTRSAEKPAGLSVPWQNPTSPEIVLVNIITTFEAKSVDNYTRSLASDFTFIPDPNDESEAGVLFYQNWNQQMETSTQTRILTFNNPDGVTVTLAWNLGTALNSDSANVALFDWAAYQLKATRGPASKVFSGLTKVTMREVNGSWSISKLEDKSDGVNHTWGYLRWKGTIDI